MVENRMVLVSFLLSFVGLILIYLSALHIKPKEVGLGEINFDMVGRIVTTSGDVVYKREHPSGHIFLTISDGDNKVQVPIFAGLRAHLEEKMDLDEIREGVKLRVTGMVGEYRGQLQVIPRKVGDVEVVK